MKPLTEPQKRALAALATRPADEWWTAGRFSEVMWPNHFTQRINGPWGLASTAGPMHGGLMLKRLLAKGLVEADYRPEYYTLWRLSKRGREVLAS